VSLARVAIGEGGWGGSGGEYGRVVQVTRVTRNAARARAVRVHVVREATRTLHPLLSPRVHGPAALQARSLIVDDRSPINMYERIKQSII
jgi:hypothetical protein